MKEIEIELFVEELESLNKGKTIELYDSEGIVIKLKGCVEE